MHVIHRVAELLQYARVYPAGLDRLPEFDKLGAGLSELEIHTILKLDRAERQDEPAPDVDPTDDPALTRKGRLVYSRA